MKLKKGDNVVVLRGKDRGKRGEITRAFPEDDKVIVEGVNLARKHQRATRATMQGGIVDKFMPMPVSSVAIVCPAEGKGTRIGYRFDNNGNKVRICRSCGADLP